MVLCLHKIHTPHPDMTVVSDDPTFLPFVGNASLISHFAVVSSAAMVYDWALTFGQEFELVWMQPWSFMIALYICVRYIGIFYSVIIILWYLPVSITDIVRLILYFIWTWTPVVVNAMLGVIMTIRIRAMYQQSKKMLVFLVVALLASTVASGVITVMANIGILVEEFIISDYHVCLTNNNTDQMDLGFERFISTAIWEILAFVLAVWAVIKKLRGLRQSSTGPTVRDCFMVLTKSHAFYFVAFAAVDCFSLGTLSSNIMYSLSA
ncbi:hypothetical protein BDR03DRAFT_446692 [Suillus americanus]|nr:hypothetical protein BDR03DRAFT_446692 [Suillus americanus]